MGWKSAGSSNGPSVGARNANAVEPLSRSHSFLLVFYRAGVDSRRSICTNSAGMIFLWCRPPFLRRRKNRKIAPLEKNRAGRRPLPAKSNTKQPLHLKMHPFAPQKYPCGTADSKDNERLRVSLALPGCNQNAIRWPSKESWTFSGSRALVASYSSEWEMCVK